MLVEFSVENYLSFLKKQTLSLVASEDEAMLDSTFAMPASSDLRLVKSAVIYGANASGKSNLLRGFSTLKEIVITSASRMQQGDKFDLQPFRLNSQSQKQPTSFEVIFFQNQIRYEYGVILDRNRVYEEWLIAFPEEDEQNWFDRKYNPENPEAYNGYEWYFDEKLLGENEIIKKFVRSNSLFLSHAAQNNHPQLTEVFLWFKEKLNDIDFDDEYTVVRMSEDFEFRDRVVNLLKTADIGISGIKIDKQLHSLVSGVQQKVGNLPKNNNINGDKNQVLNPVFIRKMNDADKEIYFSIEEESQGTKRLFELAGILINVLEEGKLLTIDELERSFHPVLLKNLVRVFHDPDINRNNAQLIFATHDSTLIDDEILRRDQVWFLEKNEASMSLLYSLLEFKPCEDENLQTGYLLGQYAAVPFIVGLKI